MAEANGNAEHRRIIYSKLDSLEEKVDKVIEQGAKRQVEIAVLKVRLSIYSAIAGFVGGGLYWLGTTLVKRWIE